MKASPFADITFRRTCRQRRIKCGEERDQCENCRKSKRPCSYPQDVQLKNGNHVVLPQPNGSRHYPACSPPANPLVGISGHHLEPGFSGPRRASADGDHLPRPFGSIDYQSPTGGYDLGNHGLRPSPHALGESIDPAAFAGDSGTGWGQGSDSSRQPSFTAYDSTTPAYCHDEARPPRLLVYEEPFIGVPQEHESQLYTEKGDLPYPGSVLKEEQSHYYHDYRAPSSYEDAATQTGSGAREDKLMHWPGMSRDAWDRGASTVIRNDMPAFGGFAYAQAFATSGAGLTTDFLNNAAIAIHDDDYWDVTSEDDEEIARRQSQMLQDGHVEQDLTRILTLTQQSMRLAVAAVQDPLSYTYPGFSMTHYIPEFAANPLNNIYTQRVFAHFVFSTAPLISFLQQRNRPSFLGEAPHGSATYSCQGLWNYVLAMMALYDQGLLHAMLAMGSYHIAKLQGASTTPAQKHYGYAIRYIHKSVRPEKKRHAATTLAATLLLAFYEVMTADHRAWNTHLAGAIQLVREIDFTSMTNHIRRAKQRTSARRRSGSSSTHDDLVDAIFPDIDTKLVNQLKGKNEKPNENITSKGSEAAFDDSSVLTILELRQYSILQDLYWYACRHDMIHGMVGGTTLL